MGEKFSKDELERLYWQEGKSISEIAQMLSTNRSRVLRIMKRLEIPRRSNSEAKKLWAKEHPMPWAITWDREQLRQLYWEEEKSTDEIGKFLGCSSHAVGEAMKKLGIPFRSINGRAKLNLRRHPAKRASDSHTWRGGKVNHDGYVYIYMPEHPCANKKGYIYEHRLVIEKKLGRYLLRSEKVHHIDGIRNHNTEDNLELMSQTNHVLKEMFCQNCPLKSEIRLLRWEIKQLREELQYKLEVT